VTHAELRGRLNDVDALAITLFGEARGEPVEGRIAVGCVIRNRFRLPARFGGSYREVVHRKSQFSCWWPFGGAYNYELSHALAQAAVMVEEIPLRGSELAIYRETEYIAQGIVDDVFRDRVGGATHYYSPRAMVPSGAVPPWASGAAPVARVGGHLFFTGIA
jgi:N-acetylmuramoyl-L-alanine amidase